MLERTPSLVLAGSKMWMSDNGYRALIGLLASYAFLTTGNGLLTTLIPIRMLHSNMSTLAVGIVQSCYYAGFIFGCVVNRTLIERIGQHRTFVAYASFVAVIALGFATFNAPLMLALLRLLYGFAFVGLYTAVESWLNSAVPNAFRGRVVGSYLSVHYLALGAGQFFVTAGDAEGNHQLLIVAALFCAAVIPVTLMNGWPTQISVRQLNEPRSLAWLETVRHINRMTALGIPGCILSGSLYGSFYAMAPVFLTRVGFSVTQLSTFMGVALVGALIPQWPIGKFSDRVDRRRLIRCIAVASAFLSALLVYFHAHAFVCCVLFVYVVVTFPLYGLIVSHVNDRTEPDRRVATSVMLQILFALGGASGPAFGSVAMIAFGPGGLFVLDCASAVALAYIAIRTMKSSSDSPNETPSRSTETSE